ncbi:hypothetical protein ACSBPH_16225 [Microbacterium sp. F51-2R]|uniref:hypothetical protein n=1 Tax=Microbacterium sp. F51-2R TaxID=3445777 RepID=UPI003FA0AAC3
MTPQTSIGIRSDECKGAWRKFADDYLLEIFRQPGCLEARYACVADAVARLQALVARERLRGSHTRWEVDAAGGHLAVTVTGHPEEIEAVATLLS